MINFLYLSFCYVIGEPEYAGEYFLVPREEWYFDADAYPPNCRFLVLMNYKAEETVYQMII